MLATNASDALAIDRQRPIPVYAVCFEVTATLPPTDMQQDLVVIRGVGIFMGWEQQFLTCGICGKYLLERIYLNLVECL